MKWDAYRNRHAVLRTVIEEADRRQDGVVPWDLPGVAESFADDVTLAGALQLRWHTTLAGTIERELMDAPADTVQAVVTAWVKAAGAMPGTRAILDAHADAPTSAAMAEMLDTSRAKDRALMAAMAGLAGVGDLQSASIGAKIEASARALARRPEPATTDAAPGRHCHHRGWVSRLRARLAAA